MLVLLGGVAGYFQSVQAHSIAVNLLGMLTHRRWRGSFVCVCVKNACAHTSLNTPPRPTLPKSMPAAVKTVIEACWEEDPAKRPSAQSVHDMLVDIQETGALDTRSRSSSVLSRWLTKRRGVFSKST